MDKGMDVVDVRRRKPRGPDRRRTKTGSRSPAVASGGGAMGQVAVSRQWGPFQGSVKSPRLGLFQWLPALMAPRWTPSNQSDRAIVNAHRCRLGPRLHRRAWIPSPRLLHRRLFLSRNTQTYAESKTNSPSAASHCRSRSFGPFRLSVCAWLRATIRPHAARRHYRPRSPKPGRPTASCTPDGRSGLGLEMAASKGPCSPRLQLSVQPFISWS